MKLSATAIPKEELNLNEGGIGMPAEAFFLSTGVGGEKYMRMELAGLCWMFPLTMEIARQIFEFVEEGLDA